MNIFLYMNHTPSCFTINDDYFTPRQAFEDIIDFVPSNITIYEPFVGSSRSDEYLKELLRRRPKGNQWNADCAHEINMWYVCPTYDFACGKYFCSKKKWSVSYLNISY